MPPFQQTFFKAYQSFRSWFGSARGGVGSIDDFSPTLFPVRDTKVFERRFKEQSVIQATLAGEGPEFTILVPADEAWLVHFLTVQASTAAPRWLATLNTVPPSTLSVLIARLGQDTGVPAPIVMPIQYNFATNEDDFFVNGPLELLPGDSLGILPDAVIGVDTSFLNIRYELVPLPVDQTLGRDVTSETF